MPNPPLRPVQLFDQEVPEEFLRATLTMLAQQYRATTLELNQRREEQARDLRAHLLRANIEGAWMDLVASFPGIEGGIFKNAAGNCNHVRITGGRVFMTESAVGGPNELVRYAEFREGYATFAQMDLFSSPFRPPTAPVYAILLHGGPPDAVEPSFAVVRFPVSDASAYLDDQINLIDRYPDALGRAPSVPAEVIEDTISITVRREKGTAEEGA